MLDFDAASVTVVELDQRAVAAMHELAAETDGRLRVISGDALAVDIPSLMRVPRQIVANLPYNIATPLLIAWLRQAHAFERLTLMFQQEVAERICAVPGTAAYGRLSGTDTMDLRHGAAVAHCAGCLRAAAQGILRRRGAGSARRATYASVIRRDGAYTAAAFGQRRKMLRGALKTVGGEALLRDVGIAPDRRAETLSVTEFDRLARRLAA